MEAIVADSENEEAPGLDMGAAEGHQGSGLEEGAEEQEDEARREEIVREEGGLREGGEARGLQPSMDFPLSNIDKIFEYLSKEEEQRHLQLKDQVTDRPKVFGSSFTRVAVPETKEELGPFSQETEATQRRKQNRERSDLYN